MLDLEEGTFLVRVARAAVESHFIGMTITIETITGRNLEGEKGVFVTLLDYDRDHALRGCIGVPYPTLPLIEQTKIAAVEAATSDYRFDPLKIDETRRRIVFEVTIMSPVEDIWVKNPLDLRENIVVGRDGLVVESSGNRGLLLPQVAVDEDFDSEEFLSQCCLKADLPPDAWLTGSVKVSRFQGQIFAEERPGGPVVERHLRTKS